MIVVLEGIDFAGKTTQAGLLSNWCLRQGLLVQTYKFPNIKLPTGRLITKYLKGKISLPAAASLALFAANRLEVRPEIEKATETTDIIICDRYCPTAYAYGLAKGLSKQWLHQLEALMPLADVVLLLDISIETSFGRHRHHRLDLMEDDWAFQDRCRQNYLSLSREQIDFRQKWLIISGNIN